jgi:CubicO group peptidase (beta-lactamase class C family)
MDPKKQRLTLRQLLTMTSGFETAGIARPLQDNVPLDNPDLIAWAFARPLATDPGERFLYDDLSCHLISVLLSRLTGESTAAFAERELFAQLGVWATGQERFIWQTDRGKHDDYHVFGHWPDDGRPWKVDQHGHAIGSLGLHLTLREMARFGYLYLQRGRWNDNELVPRWYVDDSTQAQNPGGAPVPPGDCGYGYLWWVQSSGFHFALGYGGQSVQVSPRDDLVLAIATTIPRNVPSGIFPRFIRPAILS